MYNNDFNDRKASCNANEIFFPLKFEHFYFHTALIPNSTRNIFLLFHSKKIYIKVIVQGEKIFIYL